MLAMQCTVQSTFISLSFQPSNRENHTTLFCEKSSLLSLESCFYNFTLLKVQTISSTPDAAGSALYVANGGRLLESFATRCGAGPFLASASDPDAANDVHDAGQGRTKID